MHLLHLPRWGKWQNGNGIFYRHAAPNGAGRLKIEEQNIIRNFLNKKCCADVCRQIRYQNENRCNITSLAIESIHSAVGAACR